MEWRGVGGVEKWGAERRGVLFCSMYFREPADTDPDSHSQSLSATYSPPHILCHTFSRGHTFSATHRGHTKSLKRQRPSDSMHPHPHTSTHFPTHSHPHTLIRTFSSTHSHPHYHVHASPVHTISATQSATQSRSRIHTVSATQYVYVTKTRGIYLRCLPQRTEKHE